MAHGIYALTVGFGAVWIAERTVADVVRVDPSSRKPVVWTSLPYPAGFLCAGAGFLWATLSQGNSVSRIPVGPSHQPVTTNAGARPTQAIVADGRLFVASNTDHTVRVFDPRTFDRQQGSLHVAHNPYALTADAHGVWVTGTGENTVTRIAFR
jgi:DNA-binding beta-propeller fold protein YncE